MHRYSFLTTDGRRDDATKLAWRQAGCTICPTVPAEGGNQMRSLPLGVISRIAVCGVVSLGLLACHSSSSASTDSGGIPVRTGSPAPGKATITGIAFVDSSVTGQGGKAKLPPGAKVYPSGSTITGSDGCPTTRYQTDGLIVAVIDYDGRPTSASLTITEHPATGGSIDRAPYYIDLNPGRTLQYLGPIFQNGKYDLLFQYDYSLGTGQKVSGGFALARNCPTPR
jgi:hypothetical protein